MMQNRAVFVGSYAPKEEEGIHLFQFDQAEGRLKRVGGAAGVANPSFLTVDAPRGRVYAVSETGEGAVVSLRYDLEKGTLEEVNRQSTQGADPCYVVVDASGDYLLLVNYSSGSICVYPLTSEGEIGAMSDQVQHTGHGVRADRQEAPHPHSIKQIPGTPYFLVADLGLDQVVTYELTSEGKLIERSIAHLAPGSGPRHLDFHPEAPYVYVIYELTSEVEVFEIDRSTGGLAAVQKLSTLAPDFQGESYCAEISVSGSGKIVFGSNRGEDSLAMFHVQEPNELRYVGHVSTEGNFPRHFTLVPDAPYILAANQNSDSIIVIRLNAEGMPEATVDRIEVVKPVCLQVL
ncbi:lactonase family protein [Paenibacillus guangzhouensis]|uniref:lactonase family protein n=1 Tax=Paenibacillus guangzhouensis TaxID=1473112 RepID=UPI001266EE39|nr:lactonase family protein [Paenibacillus guangzhouensis]